MISTMTSCPLGVGIFLSKLPFIPATLSKAKIHMNERCECVWKTSMSFLVQGPPSQTQQGAGGGGKTQGTLVHPFPGPH